MRYLRLNLPADLTTKAGNAAEFTLTDKVAKIEQRPFSIR